ncbi:hypothetical protein [Burkholderia anthina]|uniref:hypothetical protein n=1 Tax=Burkholderia anthina TaxID=179879 RepID=UPI0029303231|nr:hypothetical protein [Burkholderia anthina]
MKPKEPPMQKARRPLDQRAFSGRIFPGQFWKIAKRNATPFFKYFRPALHCIAIFPDLTIDEARLPRRPYQHIGPVRRQ